MSKIDTLLHDAEHAHSGQRFAGMMGDTAAQNSLSAKRDRLIRKALSLDPTQANAAWQEVDRDVRQLADAARVG